jgi:hypothetical protein
MGLRAGLDACGREQIQESNPHSVARRCTNSVAGSTTSSLEILSSAEVQCDNFRASCISSSLSGGRNTFLPSSRRSEIQTLVKEKSRDRTHITVLFNFSRMSLWTATLKLVLRAGPPINPEPHSVVCDACDSLSFIHSFSRVVSCGEWNVRVA